MKNLELGGTLFVSLALFHLILFIDIGAQNLFGMSKNIMYNRKGAYICPVWCMFDYYDSPGLFNTLVDSRHPVQIFRQLGL